MFTDDYNSVRHDRYRGNAYRDRALNREEDLDIAANIFVRGTPQSAAGSISLTFDPNLLDSPPAGAAGCRSQEIAAQTLLSQRSGCQVVGTTRFSWSAAIGAFAAE